MRKNNGFTGGFVIFLLAMVFLLNGPVEEAFTQKREGTYDIKVKLEGEYQGEKKVLWSTLPITVYKPNQIRKVIIDGGHRGDYVNGYY